MADEVIGREATPGSRMQDDLEYKQHHGGRDCRNNQARDERMKIEPIE
jgi:hypothetical protein